MSKTAKLWSSFLEHRIHHPLPLSTQDSQRLLNSIKSSFRAQLEKEHGLTDIAPTAAGAATPQRKHNGVGPHGPVARPTDQHLHAILENPLFSQQKNKRQITGIPGVGPASSSSVEKDKMVFEQAVARGLMTIPRAHGFLLKVASQKKNQAPLTKAQDNGVATLVLEWLRASGQHQGLMWLQNHRQFGTLLLKTLIAEGLDDLVLVWLEQLMSTAAKPRTSALGHAISVPVLLKYLIEAKSADHKLEKAYETFLVGKKMLEDKSLNLQMAKAAWVYLSWSSTVLAWRYPKLPVHLFEPFAAYQHQVTLPVIHRAHLDLHHPERPSSDLAWQWFNEPRDSSWMEQLGLDSADPENPGARPTFAKARWSERITSFGIDTAQHLMLSNREQEAQLVLSAVNNLTERFSDPTAGLAAIWPVPKLGTL